MIEPFKVVRKNKRIKMKVPKPNLGLVITNEEMKDDQKSINLQKEEGRLVWKQPRNPRFDYFYIFSCKYCENHG